jgi:hypothetical protein
VRKNRAVVRRALLLVAVALVAAGVDLAVKRTVPTELYHERSGLYVLLAGCALPWAAALVATGSRLVAAAGGVLVGGAAANVVSLALWPAGIPDPLVRGGVAFNPADVCALAGGLVLIPLAVAVFAAGNRDRVRQPVV